MPSLRSALGPPGRPFGDGLRYTKASGTGGLVGRQDKEQAEVDSTLNSPIRGRRSGAGALNPAFFSAQINSLIFLGMVL